MAYTVGIASDYLNLFQRLRGYLTGKMSIENEISNPLNTGDGYLKNLLPGLTPVAESWTLVCTTGGGDGVAVFSVTGSVTGASSAATCGVDYNNGVVVLNVKYGATDYVIGDEFTFDVVANSIPSGQEWTELKYYPGVELDPGANNGMNQDQDDNLGATYANELYLKGPGLAGADEIHVNIHTYYSEVSDYYNLGFAGTTGFETLDAWAYQPGISTGQYMAAWQFQIPYWIVANGRRFIITFKVSTNYMNGYFGYILPYATPSEYPYPLLVAGSGNSNTSATRWSSESHNHRSFFDPYAAYIYTINGTWQQIQNKLNSGGNESSPTSTNVWPYGGNLLSSTRQSPGDVYPMLPMVIYSDADGGNVFGELEDTFWCPGFANASENVIVVGGVDYVVLQDVYRSGNLDYYALKLEA